MRVTGGELRGRKVRVPPSTAVRPTLDMVREALFSMLALDVPNCRFLDLFAGSGVTGIEAWSRGADQVVWVEQHRATARMLKENVDALCGSDGQIIVADVYEWLERPRSAEPFDIVFADPPYDAEHGTARLGELMTKLAETGHVVEGGIFVAEQSTGGPLPSAPRWNRITDRRYGHSRLALFSFIGPVNRTPNQTTK